MSQYTIDFSCNHTEVRNIVGKEKDRQGKADWMARGVCSDCYKAEKAAERQQEQSAQMATAAQFTLTDLEGSEKQIAWAEKIRAKMIAEIENLKTKLADRAELIDNLDKIEVAAFNLNLVVLAEAISAIGSKTKSTWFIDNRDMHLTGSDALIMRLVPDCDDRMKALTAERDADLARENQIKAAPLRCRVDKLQEAKTQSLAALSAYRASISSEHKQLMTELCGWSDEKFNGEWDTDMIANSNRREEIEAEECRLETASRAHDMEIIDLEKAIGKLNA